MTITEITAITKSRYKVALEDGFTFVLYKGELRRFRLEQGREIPDEAYRSIIDEILPKRARLRCMNLLKSKDYTHKQLEDKLRQGGYPQEIIDDAVAYVESYGYVDDRRYVKDFISYNIQTKSRSRIENDLMRKGIRRELIFQSFEELEEDGVSIDEEGLIHKLLFKKKYNAKTADINEKQKMYAFLYRKGFKPDIIRRVLLLDII